ncbi:MAG: UDP-N-acetylmuramoyl-L-alanine--D-glutamate ligase [Alphaproteobacteria bacterium]|nr:UDP-N-acetylmuramoyl-L-alanine--D-glutamate ligase [Alphaproteobacteria bacterium]
MIAVETYRGKQVALFGLARSGVAAARALEAGGAEVAAWDDNAASREKAEAAGVTLAPMDQLTWAEQAALVLAPGVPLTHPAPHPVVEAAKAAGTPILGDIELFAQMRAALPDHQVVAITGTNGKSTTTALIAHLLVESGRNAVACGNIGAPILALDPLPAGGAYVVEISSYQIDLTHSLRPELALLLNTTPDHLDRHGSMSSYVAIKRRLVLEQDQDALAIIGVDDDYGPETVRMLREAGRPVKTVSAKRHLADGVSVENGVLRDSEDESVAIDLAEAPALQGRHNWQNAAAAYAAARALGVSAAQIAAGLRSFPGLAHRAEPVAEIGGVRFINDSKATNAEAAEKALTSFYDIHWIAGGRAKEGGIASLLPCLGHVKQAYLIGEAEAQFAQTLEGHATYSRCGTLETAVREAAKNATPGDIVLLSPACASFDQFSSFEERGDAFKAAVQALERKGGAA